MVFRGSLDLLLRAEARPDTYIEIKNCTLVENGTAKFPDAVSVRGSRHLEELALLAENGFAAVIFVLVQRHDAQRFSPADSIDPLWGKTLRRVVRQGVRLMVFQAMLGMETIRLGPPIPAEL